MNRFTRILYVMPAMAACLLCDSAANAGHKPGHNPGGGPGGQPGGGNDPGFAYELTDLLGLPGYAYQSRGWFITERNSSGSSLIYGDSHEYLEGNAGPPQLYPVIWHIDSSGSFPSTDPVNLGLPSFSNENEPTGINSVGVRIGLTRIAKEKDENGNWVFPGAVQVPGMPYQELPSPVSRNTVPHAVNDNGVIVGTHYVASNDPQNADGLDFVGGLWQLQPDGSIADPISLGDFYPSDVNNYGVMAGNHQGYLAIAWYDGNDLQIERMDTSLRFAGSFVNAISNYPIGDERLTVVGGSWLNEEGEYNVEDSRLAYAWRPFDADDPTTLLGTLGGRRSEAKDVNDQGQIVGWADSKRDGRKAFIYSDGTLQDLNDLVDGGKAVLDWANAINNDGDIVGFMGIPRPVSEQRGFLLRPTPPTDSAVSSSLPEPSAFALWTIALLSPMFTRGQHPRRK